MTDGWSAGHEGMPLTLAVLDALGRPRLLPTPPFSIGRELAFDALAYPGFAGYRQKELLLPVQTALVRYLASGLYG